MTEFSYDGVRLALSSMCSGYEHGVLWWILKRLSEESRPELDDTLYAGVARLPVLGHSIYLYVSSPTVNHPPVVLFHFTNA